MSWVNKLFGNIEKKQHAHLSGSPTFLKPKYDVSFQMEMAKAIVAEKVSAGVLLWIALPLRNNTLHEPSFGVYVDPVTYNKLNQSNAFQLGFRRGDAPALFQWLVRVQDPENPSITMDFTSEHIPLDGLALAKLRHFLENMQIVYIYYVSSTQSNYIYMDIPAILKQQIPSLCPELHANSSLLRETVEASAHPRPRARLIGDVEVSDTHVKCSDGLLISLEDIRKVSAPKILLGVDPSLLPNTAGGVVTIECFVGGHFKVILIPTSNFDQANEMVEEIQRVRKTNRLATQQVEGRIVVGECENCHRPLRVKAHAVTKEMRLTCKCGHVNTIHVPDTLLKS